MKVRYGFVSNSSSSSFIIYWKGDLEEEIKKVFAPVTPDPDYPVKNLALDIAQGVYNGVKDPRGSKSALKDYVELYEPEDDDEDFVNMQNKIKDGWKVSMGEFTDECSDPIETMLCMADIHYESDSLVIHHDGGY